MAVSHTDSGSTKDDKAKLRSELRRRRSELGFIVGSVESQRAASAVADATLQVPAVQKARSIAVYAARGKELDPSLIVERLHPGQVVSFPRVVTFNPPTLAFHAVSLPELVPAGFDLLEPDPTAELAPSIDVFVVPGLGFDRGGRRLGQGKGFYDAALRRTPSAVRVGIGYDFQLVSEIPVEECDEPLDFIITPTQKLATGARACVFRSAKEDIS